MNKIYQEFVELKKKYRFQIHEYDKDISAPGFSTKGRVQYVVDPINGCYKIAKILETFEKEEVLLEKAVRAIKIYYLENKVENKEDFEEWKNLNVIKKGNE